MDRNSTINLIPKLTMLAACVLALGVLVLIGWLFNIEYFKEPIPNSVAMNPMSAICFIATGISILKLKRNNETDFLFYIASCIPLVVGILKLSDTFFYTEFGVDQVLFSKQLSLNTPNSVPNRMAPNTAFNFILAGSAFMLINVETKKRKEIPSQYIALVMALIALLSITGYIYGVKSFYGVMAYIPMAIHTAIGFLLLALAILFHKPDKGLMCVFTSEYEGSNTARILIPAAIVIPISLGYFRLLGQWNNIYSVEFGVALLVISIILAFIVLIWYHSSVLNKRDQSRRDAEFRISELNEELTQINSQLSNVNRDLESFSYSVSHDLKAPLRSIISYADIIEEDYSETLDDKGKKLLSNVTRNAKKMNLLIDDLLAFSKLEQIEIEKSEISMKELVENVWNDLQTLSPNKAQLTMTELHPAHGDRSLLHQVIVNLISNAIKYSSKKEKSFINVSSEIKDSHIVYNISDNGTGFDMKYANKLFDVFQRLHLSSEFEGTGIGLAIVHRIISKHHGKVWAEGKPGEGATFYFSLPQC